MKRGACILLTFLFFLAGLNSVKTTVATSKPLATLHNDGLISYLAHTDNIFSVSIWTGASDYFLQKTAELGVGWVRICNGGNWRMIEPQKHAYEWGSVDRIVNWARSNNIEPYICVSYTPDWARPSGTTIYDPPTNFEDYKNFVHTIVKRYNLKVVGLWNAEPRIYFSGTEDQWVALTKSGYEGAKQANPKVIVTAGYGYSIRHIYEDPFGLDTLTQKGFLNYVDALDVHTYTGNTPPEDCLSEWLKALRQYLASKGYPNLHVYCSEFGYSIAPGRPGGGSHTLEDQAIWTANHAGLLYDDPYVELINYWSLHGSGSDGPFFSLLDMDTNEPRPVYYAYKTLIEEHTSS